MVRCRVIATWRQPRRGSQVRNRLRAGIRSPHASAWLCRQRTSATTGGLVKADHRPLQGLGVRTSSMAATNSPTLGMHHCFLSHGLSVFFLAAGGPSREMTPPIPTPPPCPLGPAPVHDAGQAIRFSSTFLGRLTWLWCLSTFQSFLGYRRLVRNTVRSDTSSAVATWGAVQPSSILIRMRARVSPVRNSSQP